MPEGDEGGEESEDEAEKEGGRGEIRKGLEETKKRRDCFLLEYRGLFEPLLPERNYISKLAEKIEAKMKAAENVKEEVKKEEVKMEEVVVKPEEGVEKKETSAGETVELEMRDAPPSNEVKVEEKEVEEDLKVVEYKLLEKQPEGYGNTPSRSSYY